MMKKGIKIIAILVVFTIIAILALNLIPPRKNIEENPFIVGEGSLPMIAAHRGGGENNPENTMLAFREAINTYKVDIIESDLYLTKDGYLVYNHDSYIDRTSNVNGDIPFSQVEKLCEDIDKRHFISDMTLEELRQYNFGFYFEDESGERIYQNTSDIETAGLQIATVDQLFEEFYESHPDLLFIVEIKDPGERGFEACRILAETLKNYPEYSDNIVVGTFHGEIENELKTNYPFIMRGASTTSAAKFILSQFVGLNILDKGDFCCLQIPMRYDLGVEVNLDKRTIINRAHRRNIAVQFWTINDEEEMRHLIELGADCIMTDNPALLRQVIDSYENS